MKPSLEIISSNSGKMTPFMKLYWEQQKRLFTPSSSWARYHPVIIRFGLSSTAKSPQSLTHSLTHSLTEITSAHSRNILGGLLIVLVKLYQLTHIG